jgi:hypothetical protein
VLFRLLVAFLLLAALSLVPGSPLVLPRALVRGKTFLIELDLFPLDLHALLLDFQAPILLLHPPQPGHVAAHLPQHPPTFRAIGGLDLARKTNFADFFWVGAPSVLPAPVTANSIASTTASNASSKSPKHFGGSPPAMNRRKVCAPVPTQIWPAAPSYFTFPNCAR